MPKIKATLHEFVKIDWYNISQCLKFLEDYPEIGWNGKAQSQLAPGWTRAGTDLEFLFTHMDELKQIITDQRKSNNATIRARS